MLMIVVSIHWYCRSFFWLAATAPAVDDPVGTDKLPNVAKGTFTPANILKTVANLAISFPVIYPIAIQAENVQGAPQKVVLGVTAINDCRYARGAILIGRYGATNIPLSALKRHMDELPRDRNMVLYCGTGGRAGKAKEGPGGQGIQGV